MSDDPFKRAKIAELSRIVMSDLERGLVGRIEALMAELESVKEAYCAEVEALTAERDAVHKAWKQAVLEFGKKCKEANKHYARAEAAEADSKRLREALTVASQALDDAGDELNELADALSREPHAAFSAYRSARIAAALTGKQTK